jgi:hypothetical protein
MSNGKPWSTSDTATLERMQGRPDREIAEATGHAVVTVKKRRADLGIAGYRKREGWTRRDWLLHDAAGLDFQISF